MRIFFGRKYYFFLVLFFCGIDMYFTLLTVHPDKKSLSHQFSKIVFEILEKSHKVEWIDLYDDSKGNFDFLTFWDDKILSNDLELRMWREKQVKKTDKFIVFFPIWWNDAPAKFKNWYENVFTAHFAYSYRKNWHSPLLKGKHFEFIATCDSPSLLYRLFPLSLWFVWFMKLYITGIKLDKVTIFGNIHKKKKNPESLSQIFEKVKKLARKMEK